MKYLFLITISVSNGCSNQMELPTFFNRSYEQTDIIDTSHITEAITLYSKGKIDTHSFRMSVSEFETYFQNQIEYVTPMTPQFFIDITKELKLLYNESKHFASDKEDESNYLKNTFLRLCLPMQSSMSLSDISLTLKMYLQELDTKEKHYDYDYSIRIAEGIMDELFSIEMVAVPKKELELIKSNLHEAKTPKLSRKDRQGIRSLLTRKESLIFIIDERETKINVLRDRVILAREHFIENDSSFDLITSIKDVKSTSWLSSEDYPFVLDNGYVEVLPTETYRVRQYGKDTDKTYIFDSVRVRYKRTQSKWVYGVYTLENSCVSMKVGRYKTEMEVFRITDEAYLLGSEVLLLE